MPTYNERGGIVALLEALAEGLAGPDWRCEIIVVDDASPDGTAAAVAARFPRADENVEVRLIERHGERGLPTAIFAGMDAARGDFVGVLDADGSHPVPVLRAMFESAVRGEASLLSGTRWADGGGMRAPVRSRLASWGINAVVRHTLGLDATDSTGGFFVIARAAYEALTPEDKAFVFHTTGYGEYYVKLLSVAAARALTVREVPFTYVPRVVGASKTSLLRHGWLYVRAVADVWRWRRKRGP